MKNVTLLFLIKPNTREICLAMKKRGFGEGKFNGAGGKIEPGETVTAATVREAHEEIGVVVQEKDLQEAAEINFSFEHKPDWDIYCNAYTTHIWEGEPTESDEMAPQWFSFDAIPYAQMWIDDEYWLPLVLSGKVLTASFHFNEDGTQVLRHDIVQK